MKIIDWGDNMHSRIFQLSHEPLTKDEYIDENTFYDGYEYFLGPVADYISDDTQRDEDIDWLNEVLFNSMNDVDLFEINKELGYIVFKKGFKESYFEASFNKLKELVAKLELSDFIKHSNSRFNPYILENLIEDKFGFYIYLDCYGGFLNTLDDFLRGAELDTKYYFGATLDYHS